MDFSGFNWPEIVLAALSAFILGGLWYGPLFGKRWQSLNQLSDAQINNANMKLIYGAAFLLNLFLALFLSNVFPQNRGVFHYLDSFRKKCYSLVFQILIINQAKEIIIKAPPIGVTGPNKDEGIILENNVKR